MQKNKSKKFKVKELIECSFPIESEVLLLLEKEKTLYTQLDDLHQNYLTTKNPRLQKLKSDIEKDSHELDKTDPKNWNHSDRQRLTNHWLDLQEKLNDQHVDFIYKPAASAVNHQPHLGEIHLKTANQENEHLQIARLQRQQLALIDPFDNQDGIYRSNQVSISSVSLRMKISSPFLRCLVDENPKLKHENAW